METLYLPSQAAALEAILEKGKRTKGVPVRKSFVQRSSDGRFSASVLAELVRRNDERGLDLYLLFLTAATAEPWTVTFPAMTWARALNLHQESQERSPEDKRQRPPSGMLAISKTWKRLADHNLIDRTREHGWSKITALREDGSGEPYRRPDPRESGDRYLMIPLAYWREGWCDRLRLPGKALLLVALSRGDRFTLAQAKGRSLYGFSPDTIGRGINELIEHDLLMVQLHRKPAPFTTAGYTLQQHYTLMFPFGPLGRDHPTARVLKQG